MKTNSLFIFFIWGMFLLLTSCSHVPTDPGITIPTLKTGLMKNKIAPFPIYLTDSIINRDELEKKYSKDVFVVHTGHILNAKLTKAENEKNLELLSGAGIDLINLTLEDFIIAEKQEINFENYHQIFLNTSVVDLTLDSLATAKNINSYFIHDGMAFIGLSDYKKSPEISTENANENFIINDYVLSILKVKKLALKSLGPNKIRSFIIIHTLGNEINEVMERLPPSFINSLAD